MIIGIIVVSFIIGAIMGSFGLVLLDRWENISSVRTGRSMCLSCKHPLAAKDLIPLVSYMSTGGKCRYCGVSIPVSCPITEIIMGCVFVMISLWWFYTSEDITNGSIIARWIIARSMTLMVIHDHQTQYLHIPAWIMSIVASLGYVLLFHIDTISVNLWSSVILGGVFLLIYGLGYLIHWIKYHTREQGFGFGDVLVAFVIGWIAPLAVSYDYLNLMGEGGIISFIQFILGYLVVSSSCGLLYWFYLWNSGKQEVEIAFLPGMIIGFWIYLWIVLQFNLFI